MRFGIACLTAKFKNTYRGVLNPVKAFPPVIQVHFFQSWGVYRKRDDKINFYLKTFSTKIKTKLCKIVEKSNFWVIFDWCLSLCPKLIFLEKNLTLSSTIPDGWLTPFCVS